ncbi:hypothetical protein PAXRUDRAFT_131180 [Paxillus rubicundulus Ve08.2h10]|uniref:Uncharacterized protein n=1 Tax=Paxillus rubicundulus Ve08.2h10 TaxID=930991 RepID=A0A0D0ECR9_9AGAM|nr:hypothetical protein PAXRUDRAFT_131180 [Paxillus rubicundulus Ve08.2h10]
MGSTLFRASVATVLEEVESMKELRKSAHARRLRFAIDTCLVVHGIRAGYLVDAVSSPDPMRTFTALLSALHKKGSPFKNVVLWNHSSAMQSFIVNVPLLEAKLAGLTEGIEQCAFVHLHDPGDCFSVSSKTPDAVQDVLVNMQASMAVSLDMPSFSLPEALTQQVLVPLAAVVIDYPVAYVPASSEQTSFLGGEALDIYDVSFKCPLSSDSASNLQRDHVILMFSCPRVLASRHAELSPGALTEKLRVKFESSLESVGIHISVTHHTQTLDRVAL